METRPPGLAQETLSTTVPPPHPSPTPVPPEPGATPIAGPAEESVRVEAVLRSPATADLPGGKPTGTPKDGGIPQTQGEPPDAISRTSSVPKVPPAENTNDVMTLVKPGFPPFPGNSRVLRQPYSQSNTTTNPTLTTIEDASAPPPSSKSVPVASVVTASLGASSQSMPISAPLRVVSPNSVPVKKRSAFRIETERSRVDQCIQREGNPKTLGIYVCEKSTLSSVSGNGASNFDETEERGAIHPVEENGGKEQSKNVEPCNFAAVEPERVSLDSEGTNPVAKRPELGGDISPSSLSSVARDDEIARESHHKASEATKLTLEGKIEKTSRPTPAVRPAEISASKNGVLLKGSRERPLESVVVPVRTVLSGAAGSEPKRASSTLKTEGAAAGTPSFASSRNGVEDLSKPATVSHVPSVAVAPPTRPCYPPLYLPSSCHVTLGRETGRVPKDGSKVHAPTFVPDRGEFIPGPASSTREPPPRVGRVGLSGLDVQNSAKVSEHSKGIVQTSSKNLSPKESKKGTARYVGHVDAPSPKIPKREGKRSPSGDRTLPKMVSPGGGGGGGDLRGLESNTRMERRGDAGIDGTLKIGTVGYGIRSPSGMKPGDLSVITHPHGYQPLLSIGGSPPGQRSSSLSPRDLKPGELRGVGDVRGGLSEMSEKQRQMLEWHLAAASQHRVYYEPPSMWNPTTGFGTARTSMLTPHSNTLSNQESVLRSALLQGGIAPSAPHSNAGTHTATTSVTSPKMTTTASDAKSETVTVVPKPAKREEPKKAHQLGKVNFGELASGRGTPTSRSSEKTPARNPPVGIALVQQRQETERKSDSRGSTSGGQRDRSEDRRHSSRSTFSPHRDARSTDSYREHRSSSNSSQPISSRVSPHNPNLIVTAAHQSPGPQPMWVPPPYVFPPPGASPLASSSYQDVPLPGNIGVQARDALPARHPLMMFPAAADGALHGLGTWPSPYLLPTTLHPQLGGINPSLYSAQFAHLPSGGPAMGGHVPLLPGQSDSTTHHGDVHTILQQQQDALLNWYRMAGLHHHGAFPAMTDASHQPSHHGRTRKQSGGGGAGGGRKSVEGKSDHDKKQPKTEAQSHESCSRTPRGTAEEKAALPTPPSIIPSFMVPSHGTVPLFYPPYLLDTTKRHLVPAHSPSPAASKVEKKDAGTSSHSPASRPARQERPKSVETEAKAKPLDGTLRTACVQTLPPDKINRKEVEIEKIDLEKRDDVVLEKEAEKLDSETLVVEDIEDKNLRLEKSSRAKEVKESAVEGDCSLPEKTDEKSGKDSKDTLKEKEDKDSQAGVETDGRDAGEKLTHSKVSEEVVCDQGEAESRKAADTIKTGDSDSWLPTYPSCLEGQRRESLITSVMSTTQSVASKMDALDHEQLAAIEGIALLSEAAEHRTFEAICSHQDDEPNVSDSGTAVETDMNTLTDRLNKEKSSGMQSPLSISINTEEMKLNQPVDLQRRYKEKKDTDKLHKKKDKKDKNEKEPGEQTKKRGPGRPRKKKNSQKTKKLDEQNESRPEEPSVLQSSADVLLEAAASLEDEEPSTALVTKKRKKEKKKTKPKRDTSDPSKEEMSTSSIQSSADVLLEAAASLEHPPTLTKKRKKDKKDKKMKSRKESLIASGKESKKKRKKLSKKKDADDLLANGGKTKRKNKHSLSEIGWSSSSLGSLDLPSAGKKKLNNKGGEKKRKNSKVKSTILPAAPEVIDLPAPVGASLPMYTESKTKPSKNGLSISHVYGDSSDSDDEASSQCSRAPVPKGLALLASTAELSSGHSTPVKKPSKKVPGKRKTKSDESVARKRVLLDATTSAAKKLKLSKKKEKLRLQKTLKRGRKPGSKKSLQRLPKGGINNGTPPKFDAEMWSRRRSERIFLSDTSPKQSREVSPQEPGRAKLKLSLGSPSKTKVDTPLVSPIIGTVLDALKTDPFQMRQKFSQMSDESDDDDDSEGDVRDARMAIRRKASKDKLTQLMKEADIDSDDTDSDAEDMPLSSLVDSDPAPRISNLNVRDLVEGQRVLVPFDNLFYEGKIHPIRPPDVYGVVFESRRGNRPHVYSQEQILEDVIVDVKPNSVKYLPEGTRICAYWSQQFNCLYPGTVVKGIPNPSRDKKMVTVEFDDGDSGRIPLSHVRMIPQDYPLIGDLGSSTTPLERKLRQRNTETSCNLEEIKEEDGRKMGAGKGKAKKGKNIPDIGDDEVFLPDTVTPVKKRGRKPKAKTLNNALPTKASTVSTIPGAPVKKGRGRPRKIRPGETQQPPRRGRPPKKAVSGNVTMARKINRFYAGRKKVSQQKQTKPSKPGARPRGRPPGSGKKVKGQPIKVKGRKRLSPELLDPARAAMMRYTGPDDSEDAGTQGESDTCSQVDEQEVVPTKKRKGSKSSKTIYLLERQLWRWLGNATQRKGSKGKAKKVFYKAIVRGKEVIRVNECAVFLSTGRPHLPYIGRIESMWESWGGIMVVRVKWFYHPEETKGCAANIEGRMALYQSSHVDENDIQTISHKCEVLSREEYKLRAMGEIPKDSIIDNEDVYYLAGTYDPTTGRMATFQ